MDEWAHVLSQHSHGLAARYGAPVWLVGSALTQSNPHDYDVRVLMRRADYELMFGTSSEADYERLRRLGEPVPSYWRCRYECLKQSRRLSRAMGRNVDFQIQLNEPHTRKVYRGKPRLRLDKAPPWLWAAGMGDP